MKWRGETKMSFAFSEVNFTNAIRAAFPPICLCQKCVNLNFNHNKDGRKNFVRKKLHKNVGEIDSCSVKKACKAPLQFPCREYKKRAKSENFRFQTKYPK
jgi:hypothetical protein